MNIGAGSANQFLVRVEEDDDKRTYTFQHRIALESESVSKVISEERIESEFGQTPAAIMVRACMSEENTTVPGIIEVRVNQNKFRIERADNFLFPWDVIERSLIEVFRQATGIHDLIFFMKDGENDGISVYQPGNGVLLGDGLKSEVQKELDLVQQPTIRLRGDSVVKLECTDESASAG